MEGQKRAKHDALSKQQRDFEINNILMKNKKDAELMKQRGRKGKRSKQFTTFGAASRDASLARSERSAPRELSADRSLSLSDSRENSTAPKRVKSKIRKAQEARHDMGKRLDASALNGPDTSNLSQEEIDRLNQEEFAKHGSNFQFKQNQQLFEKKPKKEKREHSNERSSSQSRPAKVPNHKEPNKNLIGSFSTIHDIVKRDAPPPMPLLARDEDGNLQVVEGITDGDGFNGMSAEGGIAAGAAAGPADDSGKNPAQIPKRASVFGGALSGHKLLCK